MVTCPFSASARYSVAMLQCAFLRVILIIGASVGVLGQSACASRDGYGAGRAAGPPVQFVQSHGPIWSNAMAQARVLYQDGGAPIQGDGGALWVFGDTFMGRMRDGNMFQPSKESNPTMEGAVSATIAWLPAEASAELPPRLRYFVNESGKVQSPLEWRSGEIPERLRMWPLGGVALDGATYMYYAMIEITDAAPPWNFRGIGGGLAKARHPLGMFERLAPGGDWKFPVEAICTLQRDGFVYLFEVAGEGPKRGLRLARVAEAQIEHPERYEYCTGLNVRGEPSWSTKQSEMGVLLSDVYGQFSLAWNARLGAYLAVTSSNVFHPEEMQFRTAPHPWGPWSQPTRIAVPPHAATDGTRPSGKKTRLVYCAALHPELSAADGGEVVVTYCRMLEGDWELSNPEMLRLRVGSDHR